MPDFLRFSSRALFLVAFTLACFLTEAQVGCNGFDGAPQPSGGVNSINNGTLCLNAPSPTPAEIEIIASNVADGNNPNNFSVVINWDDGSPEQIIAFGGPIPVINTGPHAYRIPSITHQFLPRNCVGGNGRQCAYKPRVYLRIAGARCGAEFGNPPDFFRFNTDDQCSGTLRFTETATNANVFEVCAGAQTTVTFTDRTTLNCLPPQEITGLNSTRRWRRFVYGTTNTITGAVLIGGVGQAFPFGGAVAPDVSGNALNSSGPPFGGNTTQSITIPATAQVGQEFRLQLQYWNFCNQFTAGAAPVTLEGIIRVVAQPTAPTAVHQTVCNGTSPLPTFRVNFAGASSSVLWYRDNAGVPGAAITNPNGSNSKDLPAGAFPGGINSSTAGVYRVWASYRAVVGAGTLLCESQRIPVTLTIRESLPIPGPISGDNTICNGTLNEPYTVPIAAASMPIGGATQYEWRVTDASNSTVGDVTLNVVSGTSVQANFNITNGTFGGSPSVIRKIRMRRRYSSNATFPGPDACVSSWTDISITVSRNTDDGTMSGGGAFCQGENLGNVTWNPGVGAITQWQWSDNGGPFNAVPSFGTSNPVNPTSLSFGPGTHRIRARVQNGACPSDLTDEVVFTITANPAISAAGDDQAWCIPTGDPLVTTLAGNNTAFPSTWSKISGPGNVVFGNAAQSNSSVTVDAPGNYVLRWTITNGGCSSVDDVLIGFGAQPAIPVPTAIPDCNLTAQLGSATLPTHETVAWTTVSTPPGGAATFDDAGDATTNVSVNVYGTYRFLLTYSSGSCTPEDEFIDVTFSEPVTSTPEVNKTVCVDDANLVGISLTGTIGGGSNGGGSGTGQWEISGGSGSGTFGSSGAATGSAIAGPAINDTYTPSLADYTAGSVTLQLTAIGATCADASNTVTITFDKKPDDAAVNADISTCGTTANLSAVAPNEGGSGLWSVSTVGPNIADPTDDNSAVSNLQLGANNFQWSVSSALGVCATTNAPFTITRVSTPVAINITPSDLCESAPNTDTENNVDLSGRYDDDVTGGVAGVTVQWFTNAARTTPVADVSAEDVSTGSIYYTRVSTTSTPVCSADGIATFTVNTKPFVANLSPGMCEENYQGGSVNNVDLTTYDDDVSLNVGNRSVVWFTDAALTTPVATPADVDNVTAGTLNYFGEVTNTLTGCANVAEVSIQINPIPDPNPIDGPLNICFDADEVHFFQVGTFKPNYTYQWTIPGTATNVTGISDDFFVTLQFPDENAGTITLEVLEISPEGCSNTPLTHDVSIEPDFAGLTITGDTQICDGEANVLFQTQNFPYTYLWTVPPGATIIQGQGTDQIRVNLGSQSGDITVTPNTNNCTGPNAVLPLTILPKPVMLGQEVTICSDDPANVVLTTDPAEEPAASFLLGGFSKDLPLFEKSLTAVNTTGSSSLIASDVFENKTGGRLTARYTVIPISADDCHGASNVITVHVNPEPQMETNLSKDLCSEEATGIILRPAVGSAFADQYIIRGIGNPQGLTTVAALPPLNTPLSDQAIRSDQWIHPGAPTVSPAEIRYTIAPRNSNTGCVGDPPTDIVVQIYPKPIFDPVVNPAAICSETNTNLSLTTSNVGTASIAWTLDYVGPNILGANAGATATQPALVNDVLTNSSTLVDFMRYRVVATNQVNALKSCTSNPLILQVDVNPTPQINTLPQLSACSDAPNNGLIHTANLTDLDDDLANPANTNIAWYEDDPSAPGATLIADPTAYAIQHNVPVFAQVTSTLPSACQEVVEITYVVHNGVDISLTEQDISCSGAANGSIEVFGSHGSGNYFYQIGSNPFISAANPYTFNNLAPGSYTITLKDDNNCEASAVSQIIVEPEPLITTVADKVDVECFFDSGTKDENGRIEITATGGPSAPGPGLSGTYDFTLFPGGAGNSTGVFENLKPGLYTVRVADATNTACRTDAPPIEILVPAPLEIVSVNVPEDANGNNISCFGATNGEIHVVAGGGTGTYDFTLTPAHPNNPVTEVAGTPVIFDALGANTYQIRVVDTNGCVAPQRTAVIRPVLDLSPGLVGTDQDLCRVTETGPEAAVPFTEIVPPFGGTNNPQFLWQFRATPPPGDDGDGDPLNDAGWTDLPGSDSNNFDPNATLNRVEEQLFYRRLVRNDPTGLPNVPAGCLIYKTNYNNIVKLTNRNAPEFALDGGSIVCEDVASAVKLVQNDGRPPVFVTFKAFDGDITRDYDMVGQSEPIIVKNAHLSPPPVLTFTEITDIYGCRATDLILQPQFIPKPNFDLQATAQCPGQPFQIMNFVPDPGLDYTVDWGDGTTHVIDDEDPSTHTIPDHIYPLGSSSQNTQFTVRIILEGVQECPKLTRSIPVTVFPTIALQVLQPESDVCSGETITFEDNSLGVASATWQLQYTDPQSGNIVPVQTITTTGQDVSFQPVNNSSADPLLYTIQYIATNNQNCSTSELLGPVSVYKMPTASFSYSPADPQMIGGLVDITYTIANHDPSFFDYDWPGDTQNLESEQETGDQRIVAYSSDANRTVTLKVTNRINAECTASIQQLVPINSGTPVSGFLATPLAGCFPITVTTENFSVSANQFVWRLTSSNGTDMQSTLREPQFTLNSPGVYFVTMEAYKDGNLVLDADGEIPNRTITVFDVPIADFILRQQQVYIGQEIEPINLSRNASEFLWEFGDGETSIEVQPKHKYTLEGRDSITLIAMKDNGQFDIDGDGTLDENVICADTTKLAIHVIAGGALKIPNAFTPSTSGPNNGQEDVNFNNDVFLPIMEGVEEFTMQVFDRWGTLVFESRDKRIGWNGYDRNGRLMPAGVYVYKLVMRLGDGQRTTKVGDVTLIR